MKGAFILVADLATAAVMNGHHRPRDSHYGHVLHHHKLHKHPRGLEFQSDTTVQSEMPSHIAEIDISRRAPQINPACLDSADDANMGCTDSAYHIAGNLTTLPCSQTSTASTNLSGITGEGQYGMSYTPYTQDGGCKGKNEVLADLKVITNKGFDRVRFYSTDCSALSHIGEACKNDGCRMILGIYIDQTGIAAAEKQVQEIADWAKWDLVDLVVVGNEAIQNRFCDAPALAAFIRSTKATLKAHGYNGKVTTAETANVWQRYGASHLCAEVDLVGANIHPYFNPTVEAAKAGKFVVSQIDELSRICMGQKVINLETGWPNAGVANGAAVPGEDKQVTAIMAIAKAAGARCVFFSYSNDLWKSPGDFNVEQHWGCADVF
ncbi:uncharacterized protein N7446_010729 [Penicillium canescens]|uniref:Probable beta-glucosidase btgE n=1 Tax=Penicillium canescens TaxID=5083 RepID=A0AAD6N8C5_PENCN|nr:uncharacterized protein N7446_010729 [Penicillium canescens]KAJ6041383.1 hypothetical protein N7460_006773 [Penicillium canescens]KAJ6050620.1 hypothetical protein N7446_010729 [Penicillium canescens]KAJ6065843.1 hypothetical protein N7444_001496 [Penicillium canescens]